MPESHVLTNRSGVLNEVNDSDDSVRVDASVPLATDSTPDRIEDSSVVFTVTPRR